MTTPTLYACRVRPSVTAELHVTGTASCAKCGRLLRRVESPAAGETPVFTEKETPRVP